MGLKVLSSPLWGSVSQLLSLSTWNHNVLPDSRQVGLEDPLPGSGRVIPTFPNLVFS